MKLIPDLRLGRGEGAGGAGLRRTPLPSPGAIPPTSFCPPHPPGPSGHIKPSLCQAGGPEPQRAAGGGEEEVAHAAREHLEAFEGGPATTRPALWGWTLGRSGLLPPPLPSCWPSPSPGPSFQPKLPLTPATSKEAEGESGAERGPRAGWAGAGGLGSPGHGTEAPTRRTDTAAWMHQRTPPLRLPSV